MVTQSPGPISNLCFPSKAIIQELLALFFGECGICSCKVAASGNRRGLKDRENGQMGVSSMALTAGCTMDPPAERE